MKNFTPLFLTTASIICLAGSAHAASVYVLPGPVSPLAIPDNNVNGIEYSFSMPLVSGNIQDMWIDLGLTHTFVNDLVVTLTSPGGVSFDIFNQVPDASDLGGNYRFIDTAVGDFWAAAALVDANSVIPGGDYRTVGPGSPAPTSWATSSGFFGLTGMDAAGSWKLKVSDNQIFDVGTLDSASLTITMSSTSAIPEPGATLPLAALLGIGFLYRSRRTLR